MSVLGRQWLDTDPPARLIVLDAAPLDAAAVRYFAPVAERLEVVVADVTRPDTWRARCRAMTSRISFTAPPSRPYHAVPRPRRSESPRLKIQAGSSRSIPWVPWRSSIGLARCPRLQRIIYVSSGAVYKHHGPDHPGEPLPEDGYVMPRRLYGISKLASELISRTLRRFIRPLDRIGASVLGIRDHGPGHGESKLPASAQPPGAHGARRACPVRINTLDAVGDYIHLGGCGGRHHFPATRAAAALQCLQRRCRRGGDGRRFGALDRRTRCPDFARKSPRLRRPTSCKMQALTGGMWGAYDVSRIACETGMEAPARARGPARVPRLDRRRAPRGSMNIPPILIHEISSAMAPGRLTRVAATRQRSPSRSC